MGNSDSSNNFNPKYYQRRGISEEEIIEIKRVFDSLSPQQGQIQVKKIKDLYKDSYERNSIDASFGQRQTVDFNQFFEIMSANILQTKQKFKGDIEFDSAGSQPSGLFCSYTIDDSTNKRKINGY